MPYATVPIAMSELATGWARHFYSADRAIRWGNIEKEHSLWLDDQTLLLGKIDADGLTEDGDFFFADWKTISGRKKNFMDDVKVEYRLDPQMLTYGVLCAPRLGDKLVAMTPARFMVRWAMKNSPPLFFYEWYRYSSSEIEWWRSELLEIASKIRTDRAKLSHFVPNLQGCFKYGKKYACPFFENGCAKQDWDWTPGDSVPRVSHLQTERDYLDSKKHFGVGDVVILDATRVDTWLTCNEKYRRIYGPTGVTEPMGEALKDGLEFHDYMSSYYTSLKGEQTCP